jgi:hypothetical protein
MLQRCLENNPEVRLRDWLPGIRIYSDRDENQQIEAALQSILGNDEH